MCTRRVVSNLQTRPTDQTRPPVLKCRPTRPDHARRLVITYRMIKRLMHFNDLFNAHINGAHTWYMIYDGSCYLMPFCTACECTCHCLFCQHKHVVMMISIAKIHYAPINVKPHSPLPRIGWDLCVFCQKYTPH